MDVPQSSRDDLKSQPRKVLVVETDCILEAGLQSLLVSRSDLVVRGISQSDIDSLMEAIETYHPEVIIIEHRLLASHAARLVQASKDFPDLRVISMNLHDNQLYIFDRKQMLVSQTTDFLSLI